MWLLWEAPTNLGRGLVSPRTLRRRLIHHGGDEERVLSGTGAERSAGLQILAPPDAKTELQKPHLVMRVNIPSAEFTCLLLRKCFVGTTRTDTTLASAQNITVMKCKWAGLELIRLDHAPEQQVGTALLQHQVQEHVPRTPAPLTSPMRAKLSPTSVLCQATLLGLGVSPGHWHGDRVPPTPSKQVDTQNPINVHCANEKKICLHKTACVGAHSCRSRLSPVTPQAAWPPVCAQPPSHPVTWAWPV